MKKFDSEYSIDDIIAFGAYDSRTGFDSTYPSSTSSSLVQPLQVVIRSATLAICLMASPLHVTPVQANCSIESVMHTTSQAILATTESAQFKRLVRGIVAPNDQDELSGGPYPFAVDEDDLQFVFADMHNMDPPVVETRKAKVRVKSIRQAEPSDKDLGGFQTYEHKNPFA